MPSTIVLNSSNIVGTGNNTFEYKFPSSVSFPNHEIAVESINLPYSWRNISASLGNNVFSYQWYGSSGLVTYTVLIPDGLYELKHVNALLQNEMIKNGTYLINSSGKYIYYAEFMVNPQSYTFDINVFPVPTAAQFNNSGAAQPTVGNTTEFNSWSVPVANTKSGTAVWVGFHSANFTPNIQISSTNTFYKIIGFAAGFETGLNVGTNINRTSSSTSAPIIQPNANVYLSMSNIDNQYANPSSIIHSVVVNTGFGEVILDRPNEAYFNSLINGSYNQLRCQFLGSDFNALNILDPDIVIVLLIREKNEK